MITTRLSNSQRPSTLGEVADILARRAAPSRRRRCRSRAGSSAPLALSPSTSAVTLLTTCRN